MNDINQELLGGPGNRCVQSAIRYPTEVKEKLFIFHCNINPIGSKINR